MTDRERPEHTSAETMESGSDSIPELSENPLNVSSASSEAEYIACNNSEMPISTCVIYSPGLSPSDGQSDSPAAVLPQDIRTLETCIPDGGSMSSVHSPNDALQWVEAHYDDALLKTMRTHGLQGPMAAMMSPEQPALVIFGSILDGRVHKVARLLSDVSHFTVMIRPITDDPTSAWSLEIDSGQSEDTETEIGDPWEVDSTSGSEESVDSASTDSDASGLNMGSGVFRLRGGAGNGADNYTPWMSPLHSLDIHLELLPTGGVPCKVNILSKTQFTTQPKYVDKYRNGYRPQAISWTQLKVVPKRQGVVTVHPDQSYSSIGFLVHGQYISDCKSLPCNNFCPPHQTVKIVKTKTKGITGTGSLNLRGGATLGMNYTTADTIENQNDRVTPKWIVDYAAGDEWTDDNGKSYEELNVSYASHGQYPMEVEFSMGINVGNLEEPSNTELPKISFIIRNQTMLWIPNKSLKAKGHGIIVLTSAYIPEIETITELYIVEHQTVELAGSSLAHVPVTDKNPAKYPALLSLSLGVPPAKEKPSLLKRISEKLAIDSSTHHKTEPLEAQISKLPLYEFKARGWDATTERWRMPVYPKLDSTMTRTAEKSTDHVWDLEVVDLSTDKLPKLKGKQREPAGPTPLGGNNEKIPIDSEPTEDEFKAEDPSINNPQ
ncbi:hypothetical protein FB451DRAFT_1255513 [Mycena latifolia]|nr:hypothetical protein FB451DRAFT_1255513 [Mycena latifolia]